jgi:NAD(P)-dependent dehydrogenase (short-subunit alcohol dehydrogenase family)
MTKPVALITGASSGIGRALALEYARRGHRVVALARRLDRLEGLIDEVRRGGGEGLALSSDVSKEGDLEAAVQLALEQFGRLDVAIANAGISVSGPLGQLTIDDFRRVFETNLFGVLRTAYATFEPLRAAGGSFAVVGSVNGYLSMPFYAPYCASKHAARGLAGCLRQEWRPAGVSVTHIAPGFIESEIRRVGNDGSLREGARDPIPSWLVMPSTQAAREMAEGITDRKAEVVVTLHGKLGVLATRHTPWLVDAALRLAGGRVPHGKAAV